MNGVVISGTPIAVDFWQQRKCSSSKVFFLSHAHSDHTSGLSSTWRHPIYCSELTGKLAIAKCGVKRSLIKMLSVGEGHIIPLDESGKETMTVTLIDANHCPGATMFLFEGYFGRFLYTGDFRYQPNMFSNSLLLPTRPLDRLYLDNTYNSPRNKFPQEIDCKVKIMEVLAEHTFSNVVIGMHQLGKEDLLVDIANFFEEMIQVTPERLSTIELIGCDPVFTTVECRIRVVQVHTITISAVERWNMEIPTIVLIPSAIFETHRKSSLASHPHVFIIPYSSHSSYSELMEFVRRVRPRKVIPIVQPPKSNNTESSQNTIADMSNFSKYLAPSPPTAFTIPPCVQGYMNSTFPTEIINSLVWTVQSRGKKQRVNIRSAKGVVFEDVNDTVDIGDEMSSQIMDKENDHEKVQPSAAGENVEQPLSALRKDSSTTGVNPELVQVDTGELPPGDDSDHLTSQLQTSGLRQRERAEDLKTASESTAWDICQGVFYMNPERKRKSTKILKHKCEHVKSGKSCLCKFLIMKGNKHKLAFTSKDAQPVGKRDDDAVGRGTCNILPMYGSRKTDCRSKCYDAIHKFVARATKSGIT